MRLGSSVKPLSSGQTPPAISCRYTTVKIPFFDPKLTPVNPKPTQPHRIRRPSYWQLGSPASMSVALG